MAILPIDSEIFGALFGTVEMRELFSERTQLQLMLDVEAALSRAQARVGLVPREIAHKVTAAARVENLRLTEIARSMHQVGYPVFALVRELGRAAGPEAARYIHLGATTQDILDTALVLQLRRGAVLIRRDLLAIARALAALAQRYRDTPMAGRTHLQQAVPISFGLKCAIWASPFPRHIQRLDQALARAAMLQYGGAAGTLAPLGADGLAVAQALAEELDLRLPDAPWHVVRDTLAEFAALMGLIAGSLGKFAFDITLLMQNEVAEVAEPYEEGRGSSSTMPQKRNPIASEYILAAARAVHALVGVMLGAMIQDHERASGPWQSEALALPESFVLAAGALAQARAIAEGLTVDSERMRRNLTAGAGLIMAEAVAAGLTGAIGRAAAHEIVAHACARAIATHCSLRDVLEQDAAVRAHLTVAEIERLVDPAAYLGSAGAFVDRIVAAIARLA